MPSGVYPRCASTATAAVRAALSGPGGTTKAGAVSVRVVAVLVVVEELPTPVPPLPDGVDEVLAVVVLEVLDVVELDDAVVCLVVREVVEVVVAALVEVVSAAEVEVLAPPPHAATRAASTRPKMAVTIIRWTFTAARDGCRSQSRRAADMVRADGSESDVP